MSACSTSTSNKNLPYWPCGYISIAKIFACGRLTMRFRKTLRTFVISPRKPERAKSKTFPRVLPLLEVLEDRLAPAIQALSLADPSLYAVGGGASSLNQAIREQT